MEINDTLLKKLFRLSALKFKEEEKIEIQSYLKKTLSHFEKIKTINTTNTEALINPLKPPLRLRPDQVIDWPDKDQLLKQAPKKQGALVKVPPTV